MSLPERILANTTQVLPSGCIIWLGSDRGGYPRTWLHGKSVGVHRLMYETKHGPVPDGMFVCHRCDVPLCVNPDHLFAGTPKANVDDMIQKGRRGRPSPKKPHNVKLTPDEIATIRREFVPGVPGQLGSGNADALALRFGVHRAHIHKVATKKCWSQR